MPLSVGFRCCDCFPLTPVLLLLSYAVGWVQQQKLLSVSNAVSMDCADGAKQSSTVVTSPSMLWTSSSKTGSPSRQGLSPTAAAVPIPNTLFDELTDAVIEACRARFWSSFLDSALFMKYLNVRPCRLRLCVVGVSHAADCWCGVVWAVRCSSSSWKAGAWAQRTSLSFAFLAVAASAL